MDSYKLFQKSLMSAPLTTLRDLLDMRSDRDPIPIDQVRLVAPYLLLRRTHMP